MLERRALLSALPAVGMDGPPLLEQLAAEIAALTGHKVGLARARANRDASAASETTPPVVSPSHITLDGASGTSGAFRAGDTLRVIWDNTSGGSGGGGDNNPDVAAVTVDFSALGGGTVAATPTGTLLRTFLNPSPGVADSFGLSIATLGGNLVVGASHDDTGATDAGVAYLIDGSTGALLRTFANPTPGASDYFGYSVAVVGDNVLIGAPYDDTGASNTGAAYLFDGATGALLRTFLNPAPGAGDAFGWSLASLDGNILIGAPRDDAGATNSGTAYLFDGNSGQLLRTFANPTPGANDAFGWSLATAGGRVLIGAEGDCAGAADTGAAYLFDGTTGELIWTLLNPTPGMGDAFGRSLAAAGDTLLIGAPFDDTLGFDTGAAYVFSATDGTLLHTLLIPTASATDYFGSAVAVSGGHFLVGASGNDTWAQDSGAVYLFDGTDAAYLRAYFNPTPDAFESFGSALAPLSDSLLVGGRFDDSGAPDAGAVYLFDGQVGSGDLWVAGCPVEPGSIDLLDWRASVTVTDNSGNATTTTDDTAVAVDGIMPVVTASRITFGGATGVGGVYRIGDTVTASWDNTSGGGGASGGDNNPDIAAVTIDFSAFGGGEVAAVNQGGAWTAGYTIVAGWLEGTGPADLTVTAADDAGNTAQASNEDEITVDNIAPAGVVVAVSPDPRETAIESLTLVFSEPVSGLEMSDLLLVRAGGPNLLTAEQTLITTDGGLTWVLGNLGGLTGELGSYTLCLAAQAGITDWAGNALATPLDETWLVLLGGDATANGTVDGSDLAIVRSNFGLTDSTWYDGDFTGEGTVDGSDLAILRANFGRTAGQQ